MVSRAGAGGWRLSSRSGWWMTERDGWDIFGLGEIQADIGQSTWFFAELIRNEFLLHSVYHRY